MLGRQGLGLLRPPPRTSPASSRAQAPAGCGGPRGGHSWVADLSLLSLGTRPFSLAGGPGSEPSLYPQVSAAETTAQRLPGVCRTRPKSSRP